MLWNVVSCTLLPVNGHLSRLGLAPGKVKQDWLPSAETVPLVLVSAEAQSAQLAFLLCHFSAFAVAVLTSVVCSSR